MRTPKQIAASRANGAKSKGPVTPEGKRTSSKNSTKHGLLAATVVLQAEEQAFFIELVQELMEEHQPATPTERMLVETIAAARWRQDRIWGFQKTAFDRDIQSQPPTASAPQAAVQALNNPDAIRTHELLLRYEIALDRQISRALLRLLQLQSRRAPNPSPDSNGGVTKKEPPTKRTQQPLESKPPAAPKPTLVPTPQPSGADPLVCAEPPGSALQNPKS